MWRSLRRIETPVVEPYNKLVVSRATTFPYSSEVLVPVKHDFSETFEREKLDGKTVGKGELHNIVTCLCKLQFHSVFDFILYFYLFYTDDKATDQPRVEGSPNPVLI